MIEYYTSTLNPGHFFAAMDGVIVGMFHDSFWMDRCIYRPIRSHYIKIEWSGIPYDPDILVNSKEFYIVKVTGQEVPRDAEIAEIARLNARC